MSPRSGRGQKRPCHPLAESKTSRIVFTIAKPGQGGKVVFSKIFRFLNKG